MSQGATTQPLGHKNVQDAGSEFAYDGPDQGQPAKRTTMPGASGTGQAAQNIRRQLAVRAPVPRVKLSIFRSVVPLGVTVMYSENKISIMPKLEEAIAAIAEEMAVDLGDSEEAAMFLYALVTDVYVNPYSDKYSFEGNIDISGREYPRRHIRDVLHLRVGTHYRRYARAMSATVVGLMEGNPDFNEVLDKRALELNISRAEAVMSFDGADALVEVNRDVHSRNAAARVLALAKRDTGAGYKLNTSSVASGAHSYAGNSSGAGGEGVAFTQQE